MSAAKARRVGRRLQKQQAELSASWVKELADVLIDILGKPPYRSDAVKALCAVASWLQDLDPRTDDAVALLREAASVK